MKTPEETIKQLRHALVALAGVDGKEELQATEVIIRASPLPQRDKTAILDTIHALLDTLP